MRSIDQAFARFPHVRAARSRVFDDARAAWARAREGTPTEIAFRFTIATVVALGLFLRARGFLWSIMSLWQDEATWAIRLMDDPISEHLIRPIGFMAVTKALARLLGPSETVLRLLPWCAGAGLTLLSPALARRLFRSGAARLLFVSVLALDPNAIDLAKEFKPYSVGLALHTGLVFLVLRYWDGGRARDLAVALAVALGSVLFAQDVTFAYPGLFSALAIAAFRARRVRHLAAVVLVALSTFAVVLCLYLFVWSRLKLDEGGQESYWGKKYDVFYVPSKKTPDKADWTLAHYGKIAEMPGARRSFWTSERYPKNRIDELRSGYGALWLLLHVAGLTLIVRARRWRDGLLVVSPLAVMTAFNVLGFWPLGEFRTNLFTLVYAAAIAAIGVDRNAHGMRWGDFVPAAALIFAPLLTFERTWHSKKEASAYAAYYPRALKQLIHLQGAGYGGPREKVFADSASCEGLRYYLEYHPRHSKGIGEPFGRRFDLQCKNNTSRGLLAPARHALKVSQRVWIFASKTPVVEKLERSFPSDLKQVASARIGGAGEHLILGVEAKPEVREPEPSAEPETEPEPDPSAVLPP